MVEMKDYDADSYELEFEDDTSAEERKFYVEAYPNVNMVASRKLHCTSCNTHIGSSPASENIVRMHPVLKVSHCKKCHSFYNSGEFSKGEDGSELYCRWCGQGGEVYCCSNCPYVFCRKCITLNLSKQLVTDIMNNDNWDCFGCSSKSLWPLRAQHWAHVNYIEKMKKKILSEYTDDDVIFDLMNKDPSTCCKEKKKSTKDLKKRKRKRRMSSSGDDDDESCRSTPEPKRSVSLGSATLPNLLPASQRKPEKRKPEKAEKPKSNDNVVCTPDILSFLNEQNENTNQTVSGSKQQPSSAREVSKTPLNVQPRIAQSKKSLSSSQSQPPPLLIRNFTNAPIVNSMTNGRRVTPIQPTPPSGNTPVYHTINGFRIDLNTAAQQETYRLPNGKLIQVKKQPAAVNQGVNQNQVRNNSPANIITRPPLIPQHHQAQPQLQPPPQPQLQQQPQTFTTIRYNVQPASANPHHAQLHMQHIQQQQQILNGLAIGLPTPPQQLVAQGVRLPIGTTVRPQPTVYPNTAVGRVRTQLESQVIGGQEVCQHIIGKLNTLMVSNAYKNAKSYNDVKELQIHLSYLMTYAIGRFKSLQDKCTDEMKKLGFAADAENIQADKKRNYKEADDDLEIVEPTQTFIEIDSDDEDSIANRSSSSKNRSSSSMQSPTAGFMPATALVETVMDMTCDSDDELEIPTPPALDSPIPTVDPPTTCIDIANDPKLHCAVEVRISKVDDFIPGIKEKLQKLAEAKSKKKSQDKEKNDTDKEKKKKKEKENENDKSKDTEDDVEMLDLTETGSEEKIDKNKRNEIETDKEKSANTIDVDAETGNDVNKDKSDDSSVEKASESEVEQNDIEFDSRENKKKEDKDNSPKKTTEKSTEKQSNRNENNLGNESNEDILDDEKGIDENSRIDKESIENKSPPELINASDDPLECADDTNPLELSKENCANISSDRDEKVGSEDEKNEANENEESNEKEESNKLEELNEKDESNEKENDDPIDCDDSADKRTDVSMEDVNMKKDGDGKNKRDVSEAIELSNNDKKDSSSEKDLDNDDKKSTFDDTELDKEIDTIDSTSNDNFEDAIMDNETERQLLEELNEESEANQNDRNDLETISSPDNFDDMSKNGFDDPKSVASALDDLFLKI